MAEIENLKIENPEDAADSQEQEKAKQSIEVRELIRQYLAPAALLVFTVVMILYVIFPLVQDVFAGFDNITRLQQEHSGLMEQRAIRERLLSETNQQLASLDKINRLIPQDSTAVTGFRQDVGLKAQQNQVSISESTLGETVVFSTSVGAAGQAQATGLELIEVPAEFSMSGRLINIREFLSSLYGGDDFIIIKEMELQKQVSNEDGSARFSSANSDQWLLSLVLTKYQFQLSPGTDEATVRQFYFTIPDSARASREVLDFIDITYD